MKKKKNSISILYLINYYSEEKYILMDLEGFGDSDLIEKYEKISINVLII